MTTLTDAMPAAGAASPPAAGAARQRAMMAQAIQSVRRPAWRRQQNTRPFESEKLPAAA